MLGTRGPLSLRGRAGREGRGARGEGGGGGPGSAPLTLVPVPPAPPPQTRRRAHGAGAAAVAARSRDSCLSVCLEAPPRKAPVSASCRRPRGAQARQGPSARGALCLAGPASPGTGSARRTRGQRTGRAGSGRRGPPGRRPSRREEKESKIQQHNQLDQPVLTVRRPLRPGSRDPAPCRGPQGAWPAPAPRRAGGGVDQRPRGKTGQKRT